MLCLQTLSQCKTIQHSVYILPHRDILRNVSRSMRRGHRNIVAVVFIKLLLKKFFECNLPKHFFLNEHGTISFVLCLKQIYQLKKLTPPFDIRVAVIWFTRR